MYIEDIREIIVALQDVRDVPFDDIIAQNHKTERLEEICFGPYNAMEFKKLYLELMDRLEHLFNSDIKYILPDSILKPRFNNNIKVARVLEELQASLSQDRTSESFDNLQLLTTYYLTYGTWEKKINTRPRVDLKTIDGLKSEIDLTYAQFKIKIDDVNSIISNFESLHKEIKTNINSSKEVIKQLNADADDISSSKNTIDTYLAVSETNKKTIDSTKTTIIDYEEKLSQNIEKYTKEFNTIKTQNSASLENMAQSIVLKNEILDYKEEIQRLVGLAADGSLGSKFEARKDDMKASVRFFIAASIISFLIAAGWAYFVFAKLPIPNTGNTWVDFMINLARTVPSWLLAYWCVKQYNSERRTQEEYAFKSAIAMTLRSYSEMLKDADEGDPEERATKQLMLLKSIDQIYQKPEFETKADGVKIKPKDFTNTLKELSQIVKDLKS